MPLQIYNIKMALSSILINIFTQKVKLIDTERDDKSVFRVGCHVVTSSQGIPQCEAGDNVTRVNVRFRVKQHDL